MAELLQITPITGLDGVVDQLMTGFRPRPQSVLFELLVFMSKTCQSIWVQIKKTIQKNGAHWTSNRDYPLLMSP